MSHLDVLARLGASEAGLPPGEVAARQAKFGPNALPERRRSSGIRVFLRQFKSPLIYLLLVAAAIALALGERADAAVIVGVLLTNAIVGAFQEGRAERSMDALRKLSALQAASAAAEPTRSSRRATWSRATCWCWRRATRWSGCPAARGRRAWPRWRRR